MNLGVRRWEPHVISRRTQQPQSIPSGQTPLPFSWKPRHVGECKCPLWVTQSTMGKRGGSAFSSFFPMASYLEPSAVVSDQSFFFGEERMPFPSSLAGLRLAALPAEGGICQESFSGPADADSLFLPRGQRVGVAGESDAGRQAVSLGGAWFLPSEQSRVLGTLEMLGSRRAQEFGSLRNRESRGALPFSPAWTHLWGTLSP